MTANVGMMIAMFYGFIPLIWKAICWETAFFHKENYIIFGLFFMNIFNLKMLNWALVKLLEILFDMKLDFKMNIISMLDPKFAVTNKME